MNVKDAIERIIKQAESEILLGPSYRRDMGHDKLRLIQAYRAIQKRERDMFKKMSPNCVCCQHTDMGTCSINNGKKCAKRNCPLLKGGANE